MEVNRTVLAGMLSPMAKVSVANKHLIKPSPNKISIVSLMIGSRPVEIDSNFNDNYSLKEYFIKSDN